MSLRNRSDLIRKGSCHLIDALIIGRKAEDRERARDSEKKTKREREREKMQKKRASERQRDSAREREIQTLGGRVGEN